ncbi:GNAT family N-acetyltransferase [Arthrobacter psychrolactophilus]
MTETAAADYTAEQIQAWARPQEREIATWHTAMQARNTYIASIDGVPAGFSDVDGQGYIDMMFVAPAYLRRGVAQQLLRHIEEFAQSEGMSELTANVSITARRFFEHHGFVVQAEQHPVMLGVQLTNYAMKKRRCQAVLATSSLSSLVNTSLGVRKPRTARGRSLSSSAIESR